MDREWSDDLQKNTEYVLNKYLLVTFFHKTFAIHSHTLPLDAVMCAG